MMRTLIDTNILIALEDDHVLGDAFTQFHREASKSTVLLVHPSTKVDIEQDKNFERRAKTLSKYYKYQELEKPPEPDATFISRFGGIDNSHDKVDASLLSAVTHNSVDFLITQDSKLLKKASLFSVDERVLTVDQAAIFFKRLGTRYIPRTTLLQHLPTHKLDISDPFFDSLKKDYGAGPFSDWFEKTKREGRKCWVLFVGSKIQALLIYKEEPQADSISIPVPTLKLCTFKVSESLGGKRIAELMLKLAFQYAIKTS